MPTSPDRIPGQDTRPRRALASVSKSFVPYTGAIKNVDIGAFDFTTTGLGTFGTLTVNGIVTLENGETIQNTPNGTITFATAIIDADGLVIGVTSGGAITDIKDEDDFSSDSQTALATQQSIKAFIDTLFVPYTGATGHVTLGAYNLTATDLSADRNLTVALNAEIGGSLTINYGGAASTDVVIIAGSDGTADCSSDNDLWDFGNDQLKTIGSVNLAFDGAKLLLGTGSDGEIYVGADGVYLANITAGKDIKLVTNSGMVVVTGDVAITGGGSAPALLMNQGADGTTANSYGWELAQGGNTAKCWVDSSGRMNFQSDASMRFYTYDTTLVCAFGAGSLNFFDNKDMRFGGGGDVSYFRHSTDQTANALLISLNDYDAGVDSRTMIITVNSHKAKNFDHAAQLNPTIFLHSDENPDTDNTQWLSLTHDQTDGIIATGKGDLHLRPVANTTLGGITNYTKFAADGSLTFVGTAGLVFGHMYTNSTIATTLTDQNTWYELDGATAWTTGQVHKCTFSDPAITVLEPGMYEISWSLSTDFSASPGSKQEIEYGVMVGGAIQNEGRATRTLANSTDTGNACGVAVLDLPDNSIISLAARNVTSAGKILHVERGNMVVKQIGGT